MAICPLSILALCLTTAVMSVRDMSCWRIVAHPPVYTVDLRNTYAGLYNVALKYMYSILLLGLFHS